MNSSGNPNRATSGTVNAMTGRSPYHPVNTSRRRSSGAGVGSGGIHANMSMTGTIPGRSSAVTTNRTMAETPVSQHFASSSSTATTPPFTSVSAVAAAAGIMATSTQPHTASTSSSSINSTCSKKIENNITEQLRTLVTSSLEHNNSFSTFNTVFYGELLYNSTHCFMDAILYAHALFRNNEYKRCAIFLEKIVGLVPTPNSPLFTLLETDLYPQQQQQQQQPSRSASIPPILILQATILASLSYIQLMEYEEAQTLMDNTTFYLIRTLTGVDDSSIKQLLVTDIPFLKENEEEEQILGQRPWPKQQRTATTKKILHPLLITMNEIIQRQGEKRDTNGRIHPMAQFSCIRGRIYDALGNPKKASIWFQAALHIDVFCIEAFHLLMERNLLSGHEQWALIDCLPFDNTASIEEDNRNGSKGLTEGKNNSCWLRDLMISRLYCNSPKASDPTTNKESDVNLDKFGTSLHSLTSLSMNQTLTPHRTGGSSSAFMEVSSPGGSIKDISAIHPDFTPVLGQPKYAEERKPGTSHLRNKADDIHNIDQAFIRLTTAYSAEMNEEDCGKTCSNEQLNDESIVAAGKYSPFQRSTIVLAYAARRALACHALHLAAALCAAIYELDPLCPHILYAHMATLTGLKRKRELFYLAHQLVLANPKAASSWFAVGCYYLVCCRYDVAQRHFCRATRLEPKCTEAWIAFGNSFAMADESDQALAAYRAAQRCDSGNTHVPFLHMGMEYLRTSHLTLARHFFECAVNKNPDDPLPASELAVCAFRQGRYEEAISWGLEAIMKQAVLSQRMQCLGQTHSCWFTDGIPSTNSLSRNIIDINSNLNTEEPLTHVISCRDPFWEPTISNLGHSYRKLRCYNEALICYEVALRLCPSNSSNYTSLGFTKQCQGNIDEAIDLYHKALSIKPDDSLAAEMLTRALHESLGMLEITSSPSQEELFSISKTPQKTTPGFKYSLGSSVFSLRADGALPNFSSGSRPQPAQNRRTVSSLNDSILSYATTASDMDTMLS
jgi:tetratricopeptide (TPR) repeat protein